MKEFKGVWIPYEILTDVKLNDKEKINMLETIFEAREEDLAFIDEEYKKFMNQDKANKIKKSDSLKKELEKIPYNLNWLKDSIEKLIKDGIKLKEELK